MYSTVHCMESFGSGVDLDLATFLDLDYKSGTRIQILTFPIKKGSNVQQCFFLL